MCGIAGLFKYHSQNQLTPECMRQSIELLSHRGPDNHDFYMDDLAGLVHTRLSLLDLNPRSNQPFWDPSRRYGIIYNGEIYNFSGINNELERQGVSFHTSSDTEVLLNALICWGTTAALHKIEGMYAFAFYDKIEQSLTIVRDPFGIKPLYYADKDGTFVFASEIKGMKPWVKFEPDFFSIASYLGGSGGPAAGFTFFKDIKILPPGTVVTLKKGASPQFHRFFSLSDLWEPSLRRDFQALGTKKLIDQCEELLTENVNKMLVADAPVGALCSGGLDSSIIMALAAKQHQNLAIFHANVQGKYSELPHAEMLARHLKLDLLKVDVSDQDFIEYLPETLYHYGHPFTYHPNSIPFFLVSRLVRQHHVKAILSGEGADECFYGYPWHLLNIKTWCKDFLTNPYRHIKSLLNRKKGTTLLPSLNPGCSLLNRMEKETEEQSLYNSLIAKTGKSITHNDFITFQMLGYHLRTLLHRNDALGMAFGIEARFPFLDFNFVRFAVNLPYSCKVRFSCAGRNPEHVFFIDKWILRQVASRHIPAALSKRNKQGFTSSSAWRAEIDSSYFKDSWIQQTLGLSQDGLACFFEQSPISLKLKLLHLDVWARIFLLSENPSTMAQSIVPYYRMRPE